VTSPAGDRRGAAGFTLFELLIVLVILGLTVAVAVPLFARALPGLELTSSARTVAATLREARSLAIANNREVAVAVDIDRRSIDLAGLRTEFLDEGISLRLFTAAEELIDRGAGRIRFYPDGTSTGGRVRLIGAGRLYDVDIDWITGAVAIKQ
jgi:general secretion pathway protein H